MIVVNGRFATQNLTGVQRYARGITRQLLERDDVEVVAPAEETILPEYADLPITGIGRLTGHAWEQISLPRYAKKRGALLLNLGSTGPAFMRRQIVTNHDITYVRYPESFTRSFRLLYRALTPILLRRALGVITVSEFSRREISSFYQVSPDKFAVVPNAVDAQFSRGQASTPQGYLLAVSSPSAHKNFARLLEAYASLPHPRRALLIVGSTAPAMVRPDLAEDPDVRFVGRVTDDELVHIYRGAAAFIFPSLYEGFGIPPLEAQACGVPVIASRIPSQEEVLGDSAVYVDPMSVDEIAGAIESVLAASVDERAELIKRGLRNVQRYSWSRSADAVSDILRYATTGEFRSLRDSKERSAS